MFDNRQLRSWEKEALAKVSPRKEFTPKLYDPTGTKVKPQELRRTGIHDNLPVRGNWTTDSL